MRAGMISTILLVSLALISCTGATKPDEVMDRGFNLRRVSFSQLYWNTNTIYNMINHSLSDSNGVALFQYGSQLYYHPVYIGHFCERALNDYYVSNDQKYLDYAERSAQALVDRATRSNGGLYFPYQFDYSVYEDLATYDAPWYSGFAQGVMLSVFSRLYYLTEDSKYRALADSTLKTFTIMDGEITTVHITENDSLFSGNGYYWVEEYPGPDNRYVLNGSIAGAFGLFDHWWVFNDETSRQLFSQEMTSIYDHVIDYRVPGNISYYCLRYKRQQEYYHNLHQTLLNQCFLYTGDYYFQGMANILYADHH